MDIASFYKWMMWQSSFFPIKGHNGVAKAIMFFKIHSRKNGSYKVNWTRVLARMYAENFVGLSVKRLTGLRSLIWWLFRNTGWGTPVGFFPQQRLISFILANRDEIYCTLRYKRQKTLTNILKKLADLAEIKNVYWENVVSYLVRKRKLFKVYVPEHPERSCDFLFRSNDNNNSSINR